MVITVLGLNIHPAYNMDPMWSIVKCYVTLAMRLAVMDFVALASLGDIWQRHIAWHWSFP
jgi:hypothetical protein